MNVLSVIHGTDARAELFSGVIEDAGHAHDEWSLAWSTPPPRPVDAYDAVLLFGGAMHADEQESHPWLRDENLFLQRLLDLHVPTFGVCLGAQLLAKTLGARAYKGERKEVGWLEVEPTEAGADSPVRHFAGVPTVQWHGDSFELPEGVERLATSPQYENQAFRIGEWLLAVQFHPEVTDEIHEEWLRQWGDELPEYGLTSEQLREQRAGYGPAANAASAALLGEYLDGLAVR